MSQAIQNGPAAARRRRRGATMVEMTLVGIPTIFILISIFEISRGIWMYETLANAAKAGVRYATVHGADCVTSGSQGQFNLYGGIYNACTVTAGGVANVIKQNGVGLDLTATTVQFTSHAGTIGPAALGTCIAGGTCGSIWPPNDGISNTPGQSISIEVIAPFKSALALFFPGARAVSFAVSNLAGSSKDNMRY